MFLGGDLVNTVISMTPSTSLDGIQHSMVYIDCSPDESCSSGLFQGISGRSISLLCTGGNYSCRDTNFTFRGGEDKDMNVDISCNGANSCKRSRFDALTLNYGDKALTNQSLRVRCGNFSGACQDTVVSCVPIFQSEAAYDNSRLICA